MTETRILRQNAVEFIDKNYGIYALYTLKNRAIPSVLDGLKPVQRRILYQAYRDRLFSTGGFMKSAKLCASTVGNFHPHNPDAVYGASVNMAVPWTRVKLIDGKGSFGTCYGDVAAASRYTEEKLSPVGDMFVKPLSNKGVPVVPNFSNTDIEPMYLPAPFPNLLVNGCAGTAVGYATQIPQHNPHEVIEAIRVMVKKGKKTTVDDVMAVMPGPDWATGGTIIQSESTIKDYFETGRGHITVRGQMTQQGKEYIITELPYGIQAAGLIKEIADRIEDGRITTIADMSDLSDMKNGLQVAIKPKRGASKDMIEAQLVSAKTSYQSAFNANMTAIDRTGMTPKVFSVMEMLEEFILMRHTIIIKESEYLLGEKTARKHIIDGLLKVLADLDTAIAIIRESSTANVAQNKLMTQFKIDATQADYVLAMQLRKLTGKDSLELEREGKKIAREIASLKKLISSKAERNTEILRALDDVDKALGNVTRKTRLRGRKISATALKAATKQVARSKKNDGEWHIDDLGVVTQSGSSAPLSEGYGWAVWSDGRVKVFTGKGLPKDGSDTPIAPNLDGLLHAGCAPKGWDLVIVTQSGKCLRLDISKINPQGIHGNGVAGIKLGDGDTIVGVSMVSKDSVLITQSGLTVKATTAADLPPKGRNTAGVMVHPLNNGDNGVTRIYAGDNVSLNGKKVTGEKRTKRPTKGKVSKLTLTLPNGSPLTL